MKVGDLVKIHNPEIVRRIGYKYSLEDAKNKLNEDLMQSTNKNIRVTAKEAFPFLKNCYSHYELEQIEKTLAKLYNMYVLRFGGNTKSIYTDNDPDFMGKFAVITHRMVKHTGDFEYNDPEDGGNYLANRKVHVLFNLHILSQHEYGIDPQSIISSPWFCKDAKYHSDFSQNIWIEKCNLTYVRSS